MHVAMAVLEKWMDKTISTIKHCQINDIKINKKRCHTSGVC